MRAPRTIVIIGIIVVLVIAGVLAAEYQRGQKTAELLDDLDTDASDVAVDTLKELRKRGGRIEEKLVEKTKSPRRKERMRAALLIGEVGSAKSGPALVELLGDEWPPVRRAAVWALGQIEHKEAVTDLVTVVEDEEAEMDTRCLAVQSLGLLCMAGLDETDRKRCVLPLVEILDRRPEVPEEEEEPDEEEEAEEEEVEEEESIPEEPAPADAEIELRKESVLALGLIDVEEALEPLFDSVDDEVEPAVLVRQFACMAMADLLEVPRDEGLAITMGMTLLRALEDDDPSVRMFAARALARHPNFGNEALDSKIDTTLGELAQELTDEGEAGYWVREAARTACDSRHIDIEKEAGAAQDEGS